MTSFTTIVEVASYRADDYGSTATIEPTADAPIDVRLDGTVELTEDSALLFQKGRRLKVTFEPEEES